MHQRMGGGGVGGNVNCTAQVFEQMANFNSSVYNYEKL